MWNASAMRSGAWFGSMIPPEPTRIRSVAAATCAITTSGDELAMLGIPWCSASQKRVYPSRSTSRASSTELRSASVDVASYLASGTTSEADKEKARPGMTRAPSANVYNTSTFLSSTEALHQQLPMRSETPMSLYARAGTPTPNLNQPMARSPTPTKAAGPGGP